MEMIKNYLKERQTLTTAFMKNWEDKMETEIIQCLAI
jgi:hypothetical protein